MQTLRAKEKDSLRVTLNKTHRVEEQVTATRKDLVRLYDISLQVRGDVIGGDGLRHGSSADIHYCLLYGMMVRCMISLLIYFDMSVLSIRHSPV